MPRADVGDERHPEVVIMHADADADAFFAAVEQRDDSRYRGVPMVVGEQVVACASYEARALGIHAGMPLGQVHRHWPSVLVAPVRGEAYQQASALLFEVFRRFTPLVEPGSMEEAFLDVTGRDHDDPAGMAGAIRAAARREVGLPVSVGVGRTKLMAKLASRRAKPDGVLVVDAELEARVRPRLRLDDLWGVGPVTYTKLHAAGLFVVSDLYGLCVDDLRDRGLSTAMAKRVVSIATATDDAMVRLPRPRGSVGATRSFTATRTRSKVEAVLQAAVARALHRLGDDERAPSRVEVVLRYDDGLQVAERGPLPQPTVDPAVVGAAAMALLAPSGWEHDGRGVTLVGVSIPLPKPRVADA